MSDHEMHATSKPWPTRPLRFVAEIVAIAMLASCGSSGSSDTSVADTSGPESSVAETSVPDDSATSTAASTCPNGEETITFVSHEFLEPGRGDALKSVVEGFNDYQDCIVVETQGIAFPDLESTLITQLSAGEGPDIFVSPSTAEFANAGFLEPLDGLLERDEDLQRWTSVASGVVDGHRYGVVWAVSAWGLIVNRALLEVAGADVPTTYDEFVAVSEALNSPPDRFAFAFRHTIAEEAGFWGDLSSWALGHGARWTDEEGRPTINTPEMQSGVEHFNDFIQNELIPVGTDAATYRTMFWEGKVAMMIDNQAVAQIVVNENPEMIDVLEVHPVPFVDPATTIIEIPVVVNSNTDHLDAVIAFLDYLLLDETQRELWRASAVAAVAMPVEPPAEFAETAPWLPSFQEISKDGVAIIPNGFEAEFGEVRPAILRPIEAALVGNGDIGAALDEAQEAVVAVLDD